MIYQICSRISRALVARLASGVVDDAAEPEPASEENDDWKLKGATGLKEAERVGV